MPSSVRHLDEMEPDPEPPPSPTPIVVEEVSQLECEYDALYAVGERFPEFDKCQYQAPPQDTSHLLWDTFMFPSSELDDRSISPATILQLLAKHDATTFTTPISHSSIRKQAFRLNVDGGANRSVTNNLDYLHTSWDIDPYRIGGIGDGIVCTKRGYSTLFATTDRSSQSLYFTPRKRLRRSSHPLTLCFAMPISMIAGGKYQIVFKVRANSASTRPMRSPELPSRSP